MQRMNALLYGGAVAALLVTPALAQDAPAPASRSTIETVIVTAERREARSQDVPVALSATWPHLASACRICTLVLDRRVVKTSSPCVV